MKVGGHKVEIKQEFEVRFPELEPSSVWTFNSKEEAEKESAKILQRLLAEKEKREGKAAMEEKRKNRILSDLDSYVRCLEQELWYEAREKDGVTKTPKGEIKLKKEIKNVLKGFLNGTKTTKYHSSYFNNTSRFSVVDMEEEK